MKIDPTRPGFAEAARPFEEARSLPPSAYTSSEIYEAECQRVLAGSWLCAGRVDQIAEPGDYMPFDLLGEKLVLTRDRDGELHALSRICRHRSAELVTEPGNAKTLVCPYHSWSYHLDGRLGGTPLMSVDRSTCSLPEFRSEVWQGWIFVNLDGNAEPLTPQLAQLDRDLANYEMANMVATEPMVFESNFNWKVLVDNFMESYHHIATHRESLEPIYPAKKSSVPDSNGPYSLLKMPTRESGSDGGQLPAAGNLTQEERDSLLAGVVYPFHLFAPGEGFLVWYQIRPEAIDRFRLYIYLCFPRETLDEPTFAEHVAAQKELVRHVHHEDIGACEAVWSGLRTASATTGPLCAQEKALWQFNQWWLQRMSA